MTDVSPISRDQLRARRKTLRNQRRVHVGQWLWRLLAMSGLTTAIFWGATRPVWLIQDPSQINVSGNELLTDDLLQSLIPLDYPQPLLKVEPETLAEQLLQRAPIVEARVSRQLLPPRLNVHVQERQPVAVVLPVSDQADLDEQQFLPAGLMDATGAWMPISSFLLSPQSSEFPTLKVRGVQAHYQRYWPQIYEAIQASAIRINELDWRDPSNLTLHTELGIVCLGPYTPSLDAQLAMLGKMKNLPEELQGTEVAHIDLTNPAMPSIAIVEQGTPP
jgi:cell division protein FtsQ